MSNTLKMIDKNGYFDCGNCGGLVESDSFWLGETDGRGSFEVHHRCEDCGRFLVEVSPE